MFGIGVCLACKSFQGKNARPRAEALLCYCRKQKLRADGTAEPERVPRWRKALLWLGIALLLLFVFFLLIVSLIASFNPGAVNSHRS